MYPAAEQLPCWAKFQDHVSAMHLLIQQQSSVISAHLDKTPVQAMASTSQVSSWQTIPQPPQVETDPFDTCVMHLQPTSSPMDLCILQLALAAVLPPVGDISPSLESHLVSALALFEKFQSGHDPF